MLGLVLDLIGIGLQIYIYALLAYILMSWFPGAREAPIGMFLASICEPYLEQFRRFIPPLGMIDISPLVGIIVLQFAKNSGLSALRDMLISWL
ncbi:MAG TPA: YggT family protein [Virgibacillus sp.]|nr:YggT family protein [Virgibacillus sp.]